LANLLQNDIKDSAEIIGLWHRRLRDVQMYRGSSSPFDEIIAANGKSIAIEAKIINDKAESKSFPFERLSEEQIRGLIEFNKHWNHKSYILINFRWINSHKGRTFALTIEEFLYLRYAMVNNEYFLDKYPRNAKSIPLEYFIEETTELKRLGKGWDLRVLFSDFKEI
jgi:penicillin-binding protein-related factor A (putative recombinase)